METELTRSSTVEILGIWLAENHAFRGRYGMESLNHPMRAVPEVRCVAGRGLEGDRYFDYKEDYKGQLTLLDAAVVDELADAFGLGELPPASLRRNLLVRGLDLNSLVGKTFRLGEVLLEGSERCEPCTWMDEAVTPGAFEWLKGRGGLRCRIREGGTLRIGRC